MNILKQLNQFLLLLEKITASVMLFFLCTFLILDVVFREVLNSSLPWAQKFAVYLMVWIGLIGANLVAYKDEHLAPTIGDKVVKKRIPKLYLFFKYFINILFNLVLAYYSFFYVVESYEFQDKSLVFDIPVWIFQLIFVYCFSILTFRSLIHLINNLTDLKNEGTQGS